MAPRRYQLGRRAETAAVTRDRILRAALELYREVGLARTTLKAVAERADVSRGTILHHFGDADGLLDAALESILVSLELPDARVLAAATDAEERIRAFATAMVEFFDRSTAWWPVFESAMERPRLKARETEYAAAMAEFAEAAFGAVAAPHFHVVVGTITHPWTIGNLRYGGLSVEDTSSTLGDLLVDAWRRAGGDATTGREAA
jgi:AcrR family transcriptional regulator